MLINMPNFYRLQRTRLNGSAPEPTRLRPDDSDDEDVDELATPAPQSASTSGGHPAATEPVHRRVLDEEMQPDDDDEEEDEDSDDENSVRNKALAGGIDQKGVSDAVDTLGLRVHV